VSGGGREVEVGVLLFLEDLGDKARPFNGNGKIHKIYRGDWGFNLPGEYATFCHCFREFLEVVDIFVRAGG